VSDFNTQNPSDEELKQIALVCFRSSVLDSWLSRFPSDYRPESLDFSQNYISDDFVTRFSNGYRTARAGKSKYEGNYSWYVYDSIFLKGFEIGEDPDTLIKKEAAKRREEYQAALKKQQDWDAYVKQNDANKAYYESRSSGGYGGSSGSSDYGGASSLEERRAWLDNNPQCPGCGSRYCTNAYCCG